MTVAEKKDVTVMAHKILGGDNKLGINLFEQGWSFDWNNTKRALGQCHHSKRIIFLSEHFLSCQTMEEWVDTIIHELAHAISPSHGHGREWKYVMRCLGVANPTATAKPKANDYSMRDISKYALVFPLNGGLARCGSADRRMTRLSERYHVRYPNESRGTLRLMDTAAFLLLPEYKRFDV